MTTVNWAAAALAATLLAGCDDAASLVEEATAKGGETDVPAADRQALDPATAEALRQRIQGQNFN